MKKSFRFVIRTQPTSKMTNNCNVNFMVIIILLNTTCNELKFHGDSFAILIKIKFYAENYYFGCFAI